MRKLLKWDGHTHTQYCKHGSAAPMEDYIERAAELGFERYTLSEHPPLPAGWIDNEPLMQELAMGEDELPLYLDAAHRAKEAFRGRIEVTVGLEMDYLHGRTDYSERLLNQAKGRLDDILVSVHYLPGAGGMRCIDFTPDDFREGLLAHYGSMDAVIDEYYDHVESAIRWASGLPYRKRLGHINLIEKFSDALPPFDPERMKRRLEAILPLVKESGMALDVNVAGLRVKTCGKPYMPEWFLDRCLEEGIALVYGSDAHKPADAGADWDWFLSRFNGSGGRSSQ